MLSELSGVDGVLVGRIIVELELFVSPQAVSVVKSAVMIITDVIFFIVLSS